mgnify:CR=1 FL=1
MSIVRIKLKSISIDELNKICTQIKDIVSKFGTPNKWANPITNKKTKNNN